MILYDYFLNSVLIKPLELWLNDGYIVVYDF